MKRERFAARFVFAQTAVRKTLAALARPRLWLFLLGALLFWGATGCAPSQSTPLMGPVPATAISPGQATPTWTRAAASAPTNTPLRIPTFTRAPILGQPTIAVNQTGNWSLSILHTNDVRGYLDRTD